MSQHNNDYKEEILDIMIEMATPMTEEAWLEVGRLGVRESITYEDMVNFVDKHEPADKEDWTLRVELFETMLACMSAMREAEKVL
jgi:hypothetical protein